MTFPPPGRWCPADAAASSAEVRMLLDLGAEGAWWIESGRLDIFAVARDDRGEPGRRRFMCRVQAPHVVFGVSRPGGDGMELVAVGAPGTRVMALDQTRMQQALEDRSTRSDVLVALHTWLGALAQSVAAPVRPRQLVEWGDRETVEVGAGTILSPGRDLRWVKHVSGSSMLAGLPIATLEGGELLPLCPPLWIQVTSPSTIIEIDPMALPSGGELWRATRRFHAIVLDHAAEHMQVAEDLASSRLVARRVARHATMRQAVADLTECIPTTRRADSPPPPAFAADAALASTWQACHVVARYLGLAIEPPPDVAEDSPDAVERFALASHVRARRVALRSDWWRHDCGPLIARWEEGDAVALLPSGRGRYLLVEGSHQPRPVDPVLAARLAPFAYTLYRPFGERSINLRELSRFAFHGTRGDFLRLGLAGGAVGLLAIAVPLATGIIFGSVIPSADRTQLWQLTALLLVCAATSGVFGLWRSLALVRLEARMGASVPAAVWDRLLALPVPFFRAFSSGDLATRAMGIDEVRRTLFGAVLNAALNAIFSMFSVVLLFHYSRALGMTAVGLIGVGLAVTVIASYYELREQRAVAGIRGKIAGHLLELLTGIAKVKTCGAEAHAFRCWTTLFGQQRGRQFRARVVERFAVVFRAMFPLFATAVLFLVAAPLTARTGALLTTGDFLAFVAAFNICATASLTGATALMKGLAIVPLYERAKPILTAVPEVTEGRHSPGELSGLIELRHVAFRYTEDGPSILQDVSLSARPGQFLALVGPSGSGKSTILRLLLGFERATSGAILFDEHDLTALNIQAVRRQMGVVLQSGRLMSGDIFSNIVGSSNATLDDAWNAAVMAGLEDDIRDMPMGMHTVVSEGGGTLSGGQRQRLLIARAVLQRPRILLFDEATSALDNRTQEIVSRSLERLHATRIVVAHRLSTVRNADQIIVVRSGRVQEQGQFDELMRQDGEFAALARRQIA